uniref:ZP domain-containing protein n=1 Tax=Varanus komodoensis TaxID=61221 RepID=A0A8D2IXS3_VARKO
SEHNQKQEFLLMSEPTYYLGDLINIQASVRKGNHVPLKIYVDECVARPSAESTVKYEVITNHGCLVDGQYGHSRFLAPPGDGTLRFQLDTFTFTGASSNQIYLICHLKAVSVGSVDRLNKACSYDLAMATWSSHEGADCSCCASPGGCGTRRRRRRGQPQQRKGELTPLTPPCHVIFGLRGCWQNSPQTPNRGSHLTVMCMALLACITIIMGLHSQTTACIYRRLEIVHLALLQGEAISE